MVFFNKMAPYAALLAGLLLVAGRVAAQDERWQPTSGPGGGFVQSLTATTDGDLFAVVAGYLTGRVYHSGDGGETWQPVPLPFDEEMGLAVSPTGLLIVWSQRGEILRSRDDGQNWHFLSLSITPNAVAFDSAGTVLVGADDGVYRSGDEGDTWQRVGLTGQPIKALVATGSGKMVAVVRFQEMMVREDILYQTDDDGATWREAAKMRLMWQTAGHPNGDAFFSGYTDDLGDGVFRLSAAGEFSNVGLDSVFISALAVDADGHLFAGTAGLCSLVCFTPAGLYRSNDDGATWTHLGLHSTAVTAIAFDAQGRLLAGTQGLASDIGTLPSRGILRRADDEGAWTSISRGVPHARVYTLVAGRDGVLYAAADHNVFRSDDEGTNWSTIYTIEPTDETPWVPFYNLVVHPEGDVFLLAGIPYRLDGSMQYVPIMEGSLLRSTDRGETWTPLDAGLDEYSVNALTAAPSGTLFLGSSEGGLLRSTDRGETWTESLSSREPVVEVEPGADGRLFAATWGASLNGVRLYVSTDDGQSWTYLGQLADRYRHMPDRIPFEVDAEGALYVAGRTLHRFVERDGQWVASFWSTPRLFDLLADADGVLYAASWDGVLRSTDGGFNWEEYSAGIAFDKYQNGAMSLALGPDGRLYAGTDGGGVFRSGEVVPTATAPAPEQPAPLALGTSYPNPFRTRTTIAFTLAQPARVTLAVYDLLGRRVAALIEEEHMPVGRHGATWEAAGQPSGVYLYKLITDDAVKAGHMVLLK